MPAIFKSVNVTHSATIQLGGSAFKGELSLVEFWCRKLATVPDVRDIINAKNNTVSSASLMEGMTRDWSRGAFTWVNSQGLVSYKEPSSRGLNCDPTMQFVGGTCSAVTGKLYTSILAPLQVAGHCFISDRQPPVFESCHDYIWEYSEEQFRPVYFKEPSASGLLYSNVKPGTASFLLLLNN